MVAHEAVAHLVRVQTQLQVALGPGQTQHPSRIGPISGHRENRKSFYKSKEIVIN